jgi:UDP-N-acetylmuramate: L-alanyl-gamma-D-glutamyl-meso-diaminopimelate ligase
VTVIDDFAHHPTAIRETLRALRHRYPESRLWAVVEPRSNTLRRNVFEQELTSSLALADEVVLAAVYQATNIPADQILHPEHIVTALESRGCPARQLPDVAAIVAHLAANLKSGDVVAILSNGGFDGIYQKLPEALRSGADRAVAP